MMHPVNNDTSVTPQPGHDEGGETERSMDLQPQVPDRVDHHNQPEDNRSYCHNHHCFAGRGAERSTMENDQNETAQQKKLLTVEDIQSIFKIGKTTAYQLMRSNGFPALRVNHRLYVSQEALDDWIRTYSGRQFLI